MSNLKNSRAEFKQQCFMAVARTISALGTCDRKRVGAVIIMRGRCVTWGFNGAPPGAPHCNENQHGWQSTVLDDLDERYPGFRDMGPDDERTEEMHLLYLRDLEEEIVRHGCVNAIHAEANALIFAARHGISTDGGTLYVTVSPCRVCAHLIIAAGIKQVYYDEQYRDTSGIMTLVQAGVGCRDINQS